MALACVDMSAPNGPAAISLLQLPSPSVVAGDAMLDSNGNPAPLTITAFDASGKPSVSAAQFFITDTSKSAHLAGDHVLHGDKIGATVIVGQVGSLQTPPVTIPVTFRPDTLVHTSADTLVSVPLSSDTTFSVKAPISVRVLSANDSGSQKIVVRYAVIEVPAAKDPARSAVFLADNNGKLASADTTSPAGTSTRQLLIFPALLGDAALLAGTKTDTAVIVARVSYAGQPLKGSPDTIRVPIRVVLPK